MVTDDHQQRVDSSGAVSAGRPPADDTELDRWLCAVLSATHPLRLAAELRRAERTALQSFAPGQVAQAFERAVLAIARGDEIWGKPPPRSRDATLPE